MTHRIRCELLPAGSDTYIAVAHSCGRQAVASAISCHAGDDSTGAPLIVTHAVMKCKQKMQSMTHTDCYTVETGAQNITWHA